MGILRLAQETPQVSPDTTVMAAVKVMTAAGVGALAVTTGGRSDGRIVGVFTERDLMRRVVHERRDMDTMLVKDAMTSPVRTVKDDISVADAAALMRRHRFRHLAVVDENDGFLGMVAQRHLLYDLMDDLERKVHGLESYIMIDGPGG